MTRIGIVTVESLAKVCGVRSGWDGAPGCCACSSISIQRLVPSGLTPRYEGPTSRYTAACLRSSGISTRAEISHFLLSKLSGAPRHHKAPQPLRTPRCIIERNEAAARHPHQMELVELEMVRECIKIRGHAAGL